MRVEPAGFVSGAYEASNPRGYLDVHPIEIVGVQSLGGTQESSVLVTVRAILAAVP
jgi:hypothetical protein